MFSGEFIIGAVQAEQFPPESLPEIAFLGRSNVGKSSLINCLVDDSGLARTSATPGCTRWIGFYRVGQRWHFVDLPGYGYAKVPQDKTRWKHLIECYLTRRKTLSLCLLLVDARRGWMEKDLELKQWLECQQKPFMVVVTKIDKLRTQREKADVMAALREKHPNQAPLTFSASTGQGVREIWQAISKTKNSNR
ncbi:MAG: YihA family ribosome biogenesis GTP-binding protein [Acidobacteria bacterium]|nr:YihA family ribosome biogenesis GTP-binding protein [Acidobacteriota bacterium]